MKTKAQLQQDVQDELNFDPAIHASEIGVSVDGNVVVLTGTVGNFLEKNAAEQAARRVRGVCAIANDIVVRLLGSSQRDDASIAEAALNALKWHVGIPEEKLKVAVASGWLTLDGEVASQFQRATAQAAVSSLAGVRGVTNRIAVRPGIRPVAVKEQIEKAFRRAAQFEADRVTVEVQGDAVHLRGQVGSLSERAEAENAAWAVPGVASVRNDLTVATEAVSESLT